MDVDELSRQLGAQAQTQGELRLIAAVESCLRDATRPRAQRTAQARAVLAREAGLVLSLPWRIPRAAAEQLQRWCGWEDPGEVLRGMLALGVGRSALGIAAGRRLWVPRWLHQAAGERTGSAHPLAGERWAIPARWPLPVDQVLLGELPRHAELVDDLLYDLPLTPALVVAGPALPATWLAPLEAPLQPREDVVTLCACAPWQGLRVLLGAAGDPLQGLAVEIARLALAAWQSQRQQARPWIGQLTAQLSLARWEETIVIEPGWLAVCLHRLGVDCLGAPTAWTQAVEEALILGTGGSLRELAAGRMQVFPRSAGSLVRRCGVPWEQVPDAATPVIAPPR